MKQILAIFKKDARHLWPEILASVALVAALAYYYPDEWRDLRGLGAYSFSRVGFYSNSRDFWLGFLIVVVPVSWFILIARLVHVERLVGNTQFWVTRPYQWYKLLAAKAVFLCVFLYVPFLFAQCALLVQAGFNPLSYLLGLFLNLIFITFILVLPFAAFSSVTSSFGKLILLLLGLVLYIAAIAWLYSRLPFEITDSPSGSVADQLSFVFVLCGFPAVIVTQYATRRIRLAWLLMAALCALLTSLAIVNPDRWLMASHFPIQSASAPSTIEFNLSITPTRPFSANESEDKEVLDVAVPLSARRVADGMAVQPVAVKATIDAPDGAHWESTWHADYVGYLAADHTDFTPVFKMRRADFDRFRSTPVTLKLAFAVNMSRPLGMNPMPLQLRDFSVPHVGICRPNKLQYYSEPEGATGLFCRSALRRPQLTHVTVRWADGPCPSDPSSAITIAGDGWMGSLDTNTADFGITSVWINQPSLSNATGEFHPGEPPKIRHLCPGSPVTFTSYEPAGGAQVGMTIENLHLPPPSRFQVMGLVRVTPKQALQ